MSAFRLMPKLVVYIICISTLFLGLYVATNKSTENWFCTRALAGKCNTDRNRIRSSSEGWAVKLEINY